MRSLARPARAARDRGAFSDGYIRAGEPELPRGKPDLPVEPVPPAAPDVPQTPVDPPLQDPTPDLPGQPHFPEVGDPLDLPKDTQ